VRRRLPRDAAAREILPALVRWEAFKARRSALPLFDEADGVRRAPFE
jgi:hypothetical protein